MVQHYKHFVNPKFRLFRKALIFITYSHGLTYFKAGYGVELMKNHGYSKEMMNKIGNIAIIPVLLATYLVKKVANRYPASNLQFYARSRFVFFLQVMTCLAIFCFDITDITISTVAMIWMSILSSCQFFMDSTIVNAISDSLFSGMYVTMMASASNLGRNSTINMKVIEQIGYHNGCILGFVYCGVSLMVLGWAQEWVRRGEE